MTEFPVVDLVARAAALMRQRAEAASAGPWRTGGPGGGILHSGPTASQLNERLGTHVVAGVGAYDLSLPSTADAEHITAWHPLVALAVADWLDIGANKYACVDRAPMAAVARAYLGPYGGQAERPWCGAPRDLGGQQPCPIIDPCDERTCRIGGAVGSEVYRPNTASEVRDA